MLISEFNSCCHLLNKCNKKAFPLSEKACVYGDAAEYLSLWEKFYDLAFFSRN
jgi:hypothetical protein